jgi:hypothetical protein
MPAAGSREARSVTEKSRLRRILVMGVFVLPGGTGAAPFIYTLF